MTDKKARAAKIAKRFREENDPGLWDKDDQAELCEMAGMLDEWEAADTWDAGRMVTYKAADKLGVKIADEVTRIHDQLRFERLI